MKKILTNNIFVFHDALWKQNIGAAMGSRPVPSYANNFMSKLDKIIKALEGAEDIKLLKRFLDDCFLICVGPTRDLHALFKRINECHPTMKFTMNHSTVENKPLEDKCDCQEKSFIPFLDVKCSIKEGKI